MFRAASFSLGSVLWLAACAGPANPFGAFQAWTPVEAVPQPVPHHKVVPRPIAENIYPSQIHFYPERQVLHDRTHLKIFVDDPRGIPQEYRLALIYNGQNVTNSFLKDARRQITKGGTRLVVTLKHLRLPAATYNEVEVLYSRNEGSLSAQAFYQPPDCNPLQMLKVRSTGHFNPPAEWMATIQESATHEGLNPSLLAGLIAQESSFNPLALSWARAIGLTQVTPLADQELEKTYAEWPRSARVNSASIPRLKALIMSGGLDATKDWRLDPELSIKGGLAYVAILNKYWRQNANYERVTQTFDDPEPALTELVLASYNSGPTRVNKALKELGPWYLNSPELQEAQKYVNRVMSFCYQFSQEAGGDENPS